MKENSIEETIKQLKLMLKVRKEQKEIIECAGGSCINCDPDIKALSESIHILSDYQRVLKENEELKDFKKQVTDIESTNFIKYKNYIPIQKVKDKIEELDNYQNKWLEDRKLKASDSEIIFARDVLRELLEGRK